MESATDEINEGRLTLETLNEEKEWSYIKILREVLNGITDIIGVYKSDNTVLFYNKAGYDFYGKTSKEVKHKKCYEMLGRTQKCLNCNSEEAIKTKKIIKKGIYISGINKHMNCCWNPVINDLGEVMFVVEQMKDVTKEKTLQNNIKENQERYRRVINLSPEAVIIIVDNKIVLANNQLCKLINMDYNSIIGKSVYKYIPSDISKIMSKRMFEILKHKKEKSVYDYKYIFQDNKTVYVEVSSSYLTYNGRPAIQSIIRNITGMKKGLNRAAEIQSEELQRTFPIPNKVKMESIYVPAKTVSGDLFILHKVNEDFVIGILADVSGKGITAALSISAFKVLFNEAVLVSQDPFKIINVLNKKVSNYLGERYIAACCFTIDFNNKQSRIVGAGINEFIFQKNNEKFKKNIVKGTFLGMFENSIFEEKIINFESGDKFYFFTDGLEFILQNDKIKENNLEKQNISEFANFMSNFAKNQLTEVEGIKDDCTLLALEIK